MSNALKEYIVTAQNRVERALDLRLPSEKILPSSYQRLPIHLPNATGNLPILPYLFRVCQMAV